MNELFLSLIDHIGHEATWTMFGKFPTTAVLKDVDLSNRGLTLFFGEQVVHSYVTGRPMVRPKSRVRLVLTDPNEVLISAQGTVRILPSNRSDFKNFGPTYIAA